MAVVRVDDDLLEEVKRELKAKENKYRYSSLSSFINSLIFEGLKLKKGGKK